VPLEQYCVEVLLAAVQPTLELELLATDELLGGTLELLLGFELDEDTTAELELLATDELLGIRLELLLGFELDEEIATELELCATDELLGNALAEDSTAELEL